MKKIINSFEKHDLNVAVEETITVFNNVKNNEIEYKYKILNGSGVYKLNCYPVYVG